MVGSRSFEKIVIDRSEGDIVTKTIRMPEGKSQGEFSIWYRRTSGTALADLDVFGSFVKDPSEDEQVQLSYWYDISAGDTLNYFIWGWETTFSFLTFKATFSNSDEESEQDEPGTVEFYVASY